MSGSDPPLIRLRLPAVSGSLPLIRHVIATLVAAQALPTRRQEHVLLAVAAAAADAVRHSMSPREIVIEGRVRDERLVITVIQDGPGTAPLLGSGEVPGSLALIGTVADRVELGPGGDGGAATRMSFCLTGR